MAQIVADRVLETTTTTGTGNFALGGTSPGYQAFASVAAVGDTFYYAAYAVDSSGVPSGDWETGTGTFAAGDQIARSALESSNAGALVNFAAGNKIVIIAQIAAAAAGGGGGISSTIVDTPAGTSMANGGTTGDFTIPISLTFTVPTAGRYLLHANLRHSYDHGVRYRFQVDGVNVWAHNTGGEWNTTNTGYGTAQGDAWIAPLLAAGTHTITLIGQNNDSTGATNLYWGILTAQAL